MKYKTIEVEYMSNYTSQYDYLQINHVDVRDIGQLKGALSDAFPRGNIRLIIEDEAE